MTRYALTARPDLGPFDSATEAVLFALAIGADARWEAVS